MAVDIPSTPADGNVLVKLVPAIADTSAPKLTELSVVGAVDISCYLVGGGYKPSLSEQVISDERLCSTQTFEQKGRSQRGLEVEYIDNTNSPTAVDFNKAYDTLVPGAPQFLVVRTGLPFSTALAVGQKVTIYPITPGEYNNMPPEANSVLKTGQKLFVTGKVQVSVATVA